MNYLETLEQRREASLHQARSLLDTAETEQRALSPSEFAQHGELVTDIDAMNDRIGELRAHESRLEKAANARPSYDGVARIGGEQRTYQPAERSPRGGPDFLKDLYDHQIRRDPAASERIARHAREVEIEQRDTAQRAVASGGVSGFVPPQYLVDLYAELARAGRPVADLCRSIPLPETGMSLVVPRVTTGTTTAIQATENATISETDLDDTLLTVPVNTIAGMSNISRQAVERGVMVPELVFGDLAADYNAKLDVQVVNGSGASGQHLGILNVSSIITTTYTDASPTLGELWPKMADAVGQVQSQRFNGPTAIVMAPRRWAWLIAAVDTTGHPLISTDAAGPHNAIGVHQSNGYGVPVGNVMGLPVITSGAVPVNLGAGTNEDRIIVAAWDDLVLAEDKNNAPAQLRFDDVGSGSLTVRLVAYGYSAAALGRQPKAISVISGTGLVTPVL